MDAIISGKKERAVHIRTSAEEGLNRILRTRRNIFHEHRASIGTVRLPKFCSVDAIVGSEEGLVANDYLRVGFRTGTNLIDVDDRDACQHCAQFQSFDRSTIVPNPPTTLLRPSE